jgi:hypothetical protein
MSWSARDQQLVRQVFHDYLAAWNEGPLGPGGAVAPRGDVTGERRAGAAGDSR